MACFVFGGVDYGEMLEVESVDMPAMASTSPDVRYSPGRDGAALVGNQLQPMEVKVRVRLATNCIDPRDIQPMLAGVVSMMRAAGEAPLSLSEGISRLAVLADDSKIEYRTYSGSVDLTFLCPDPVAYGDEHAVTVPSGGSVTFMVGGTYPAKPRITANAVRDSSAQVWGIRLDSGDFIHVATGSASARSVAIDCAERTCIVNSSASLPTLDSDWLVLEPGEHTLQMDKGTGAATVAYVERWL